MLVRCTRSVLNAAVSNERYGGRREQNSANYKFPKPNSGKQSAARSIRANPPIPNNPCSQLPPTRTPTKRIRLISADLFLKPNTIPNESANLPPRFQEASSRQVLTYAFLTRGLRQSTNTPICQLTNLPIHQSTNCGMINVLPTS